MKSSSLRTIAHAVTLSLAMVVAGCGGGGDGDSSPAPVSQPGPSAGNTVTFQAIDHNNSPVQGVAIYDDATLVGTTDGTGSASIDLTGVHSLHFFKSGYGGASRINRDWTTVSTSQRIGLVPLPGGATAGEVSGNIATTTVTDNMFVVSRRIQDGYRSPFYSPTEAAGSTNYDLTTALEGASDLFVVPASPSFAAASSFVGFRPNVTIQQGVPATGNFSLVRSAGTAFSVSGNGGFPGGSMRAFYGVAGNPFLIGRDLFDVSTAFAGGAALGFQVNVAPVNQHTGLNQAYPNLSYRLSVYAYNGAAGPTAAGNDQTRQENRIFPTYADLAAAASAQTITLGNDGISGLSPAHNATGVSLNPSFAWTRTGTPDYVEVRLNEYLAAPPGGPAPTNYLKLIWVARVYGDLLTVTYPSNLVPLSASSFYAYEVYARRDLFDGAGTFVGFKRNGWEMVKFSPSANPPL